MGNPSTLAKLWTGRRPSNDGVAGDVPSWNPNAARPEASIFEALRDNAVQNLATVCAGSLAGCALLLAVVDRVPRREFLAYSFVWLAALFFVTGGSFFAVFGGGSGSGSGDNLHAVTIALIALCHFSFNLGPNTLTFVVPAEIFPTRYRATCHGIAAAAGKLGSVIVQATLPTWAIGGVRVNEFGSAGLGWVFVTYGFVMALGAVFAWGWIPNLQQQRSAEGSPSPPPSKGAKRLRLLPSKTLEVLGEGVARARADGEAVGMRARFAGLLPRRTRRDTS